MTTKLYGLIRHQRPVTLGRTRPVASRTEHFLGLVSKLHEEVQEVSNSPSDLEEYADVLQVLQDLASFQNLDWSKIEKAKRLKEFSMGNYATGVIWESRDAS